MEIVMGAVAEGGQICLVLRSDRLGEGFSLVAFARQGDTPDWRRQEFDVELVAVCAAPPSLRTRSEFLGLTGEGELVFLSDGSTEPIQGAGVGEPWSSNRGRMENLLVLETGLLAVGFGGQAYRRTDHGEWMPLAQPFPDPQVPTDLIKFMTAAYQPRARRYVLGGMVVTQVLQTDELRQANRAGDASRYTRLLMSQVRADYGTLWLVEQGAWREIELPTNDILDEVITAGGDMAYLRFREGVVYGTADFEEWLEIGVNDETGFAAMVVHGGQPLVADETQIYVMGREGLGEFEPAMPPGSGYVAVLANSDDLYVIRSESLFWLHDGEWSEIRIPPEIAD